MVMTRIDQGGAVVHALVDLFGHKVELDPHGAVHVGLDTDSMVSTRSAHGQHGAVHVGLDTDSTLAWTQTKEQKEQKEQKERHTCNMSRLRGRGRELRAKMNSNASCDLGDSPVVR